MGGFCCHSNQTKRQSTTILAIFKHPTQATFLPNKGQTASMALEELSVESVYGRTDDQTDGRWTKSDYYSSSWA